MFEVTMFLVKFDIEKRAENITCFHTHTHTHTHVLYNALILIRLLIFTGLCKHLPVSLAAAQLSANLGVHYTGNCLWGVY